MLGMGMPVWQTMTVSAPQSMQRSDGMGLADPLDSVKGGLITVDINGFLNDTSQSPAPQVIQSILRRSEHQPDTVILSAVSELTIASACGSESNQHHVTMSPSTDGPIIL